LDLGAIQIGQAVTVTLDAFPDHTIAGRVSQISPAADPISRLVPVEISVPNGDERIGSGLLARVAIAPATSNTIVIPKSALAVGEESETGELTVFLLKDPLNPSVMAQTVLAGEESDRLIEIRSGLQPGDTIITDSDEPLTDGHPVSLSILSE
ncbi:efflux RND transporter periplasmic adaptor subunit, partial [Okeania sp. SIO2G5]|uniref:efflux RND transporter periplasmic adaptor subunit n=1 Tax=Okeania sp. SIO2G5 TaxID=2607796 RepID=UPI0013C259EF